MLSRPVNQIETRPITMRNSQMAKSALHLSREACGPGTAGGEGGQPGQLRRLHPALPEGLTNLESNETD